MTGLLCQKMMPIGSYMAFPSSEDIYQKMLRIKGMKIEEMGKAARTWTVNNFSMDKIWKEKWLPFLEKEEREIYGEELLTIPQVTA